MSQPPDKIIIILKPNDDDDDPKRLGAVNDALIRLAAQQGIQVVQPGEIDPAATENPERAEKIKEVVAPKLIEFTRTEKDVVVAEERTPRGRVKRRVQRIGERTTKLSFSFQELKGLIETLKDAFIEMATKIGSAIVSVFRGPRK